MSWFIVGLILIAVSQVADGYTAVRVQRAGLRDVNPLVNLLYDRWEAGGVYVLKAAVVVVVDGVAPLVDLGDWTFMGRWLCALSLWGFVSAAWNIRVLRRS